HFSEVKSLAQKVRISRDFLYAAAKEVGVRHVPHGPRGSYWKLDKPVVIPRPMVPRGSAGRRRAAAHAAAAESPARLPGDGGQSTQTPASAVRWSEPDSPTQ